MAALMRSVVDSTGSTILTAVPRNFPKRNKRKGNWTLPVRMPTIEDTFRKLKHEMLEWLAGKEKS